MAKLTLDTIAKYDEISKINNNFDKIEAELQNKVLYRNNPVGEPNTIEGDVDFNNKNVFNVNEVRASDILIDGTSVTSSVQASQAAAAASAAAAQEASNAIGIPQKENYAEIRAYSGAVTAYYVKGHTSALDGGAGVFRVDASDTTSADNGGTILLDAAGRRWKREFSGAADVRWFGAKRDGVTDDTVAVQATIDYATAAGFSVSAIGGPYLISTISVTCKLIGSRNNRFGTTTTFTSAVGAGVYAVTLTGLLGALENVTVVNTGAGNGVNALAVSANTVMKDVSVVTTYTLVTGSGSIGVSYGTDGTPGTQALTCIFDTVIVRGYDICHRMRYYSNSNIYRKCYALNTTTDPATKSTAGYLVNGRGAVFDGCLCESNFLYALDEVGGASGAEENTYLNFWAEGVSGAQMRLNGMGSMMINPYGVVGGVGGGLILPIEIGAYATVMKKRGPEVTVADFLSGNGVNLLQNAEFATGLGGLNWAGSGPNAVPSGTTLFGFNALSIESASAVTSVTADHVMSYIDLDVYTWLRGKVITYACFGQSEAGVSMSIRGIVRNSAASNIQYATSPVFDTASPGIRKISFKIPTSPSDAKYLVFRIFASGVTAATPSKAGKIALPMVFIGNDLQDITPKQLTDGENTVYGNQTYQGGGWNAAHIVFGTYHVWVDSAGKLRIKNGAPASDTDGTVVGAQT